MREVRHKNLPFYDTTSMKISKWQKKYFQVVKVDEYCGNEGEGGE